MRTAQLARARILAMPEAFPRNLSSREREVVEAIAEHGTQKAVANLLGISHHTVNDCVRMAFVKSGVNNVTVLVARYIRAQCAKAVGGGE